MVLFYGQCEAKSKRHHKLISIYNHLKYWFSFFFISEQKFGFCRVIKPNLCFCVFSMGGCGSGFRARFCLLSSLCSNCSKFTTQIPTQKTNLLTVARSKQGNKVTKVQRRDEGTNADELTTSEGTHMD